MIKHWTYFSPGSSVARRPYNEMTKGMNKPIYNNYKYTLMCVIIISDYCCFMKNSFNEMKWRYKEGGICLIWRLNETIKENILLYIKVREVRCSYIRSTLLLCLVVTTPSRALSIIHGLMLFPAKHNKGIIQILICQ